MYIVQRVTSGDRYFFMNILSSEYLKKNLQIMYFNFRKITEHEKVLTLKAELEEKLDIWRRQVF